MNLEWECHRTITSVTGVKNLFDPQPLIYQSADPQDVVLFILHHIISHMGSLAANLHLELFAPQILVLTSIGEMLKGW